MPTTLRATDFTTFVNGLRNPPDLPAARHLLESDAVHWRGVLGHSDTQLVQSALESVANTLDRITLALEDIDSLRQHVQDERAKMELLQDRYRSLLAPIRRLPMEILQEIFIHSRRTEYGHYRKPPVVSQVSSHWRNVALLTPNLWSTIVVHLDTLKLSECVEHLHLWVERSARCPLSLVVEHKRPNARQPIARGAILQGVPPLARAITTYSCRLEVFAVKLHPLEARAMMDTWNAPDSKPTFPALRIFKAASPNRDPGNWCRKMCQFTCGQAPNLQTVDCATNGLSESFNFPWPTLRSFRGRLTPPTIQTCFSSSGPLEVLETTIRDDWPSFLKTTYPPLSMLTSLRLVLSDTLTSVSFPPLPALRHLVLQSRYVENHAESEFILPLLLQLGQHLRYLCVPLTLSSHISSCLRLTPNLEAFRMRHLGKLNKKAISKLRSLTHLELDFWDFDTEEKEAICDLISHLNLRTLTIMDHTSFEWGWIEVREFRERILTLAPTCQVQILKGCFTPRFNTPYFAQRGGVFDNLDIVPFEGSILDVRVDSDFDVERETES